MCTGRSSNQGPFGPKSDALTTVPLRHLLGFSLGKSENSDFSETIAACDLKVGRCSQLIEIMKVCEY